MKCKPATGWLECEAQLADEGGEKARRERKEGGQSGGQRQISAGHLRKNRHDRGKWRSRQQNHTGRHLVGEARRPRGHDGEKRDRHKVGDENPTDAADSDGMTDFAPRQSQADVEKQSDQREHGQNLYDVGGVELHGMAASIRGGGHRGNLAPQIEPADFPS